MVGANSPGEIISHQSIEEDEDVNYDQPKSTSSFSTTNDEDEKDCRSTAVSVALNLTCIVLYGYAIFYQNMDSQGVLMNRVIDPRIQPYGLLKYLTYNSLLMQFTSAFLHILSMIFPKYKKVRDFVFTALAYPIGNIVVITFWAVWYTQGRDQIYPVAIETYYPMWLNHVTHTILLPINIGQTYLTLHRYMKRTSLITMLFMIIYGCYVIFIRIASGTFVYPYLNQMSKIPFLIYVVSVLFCTLASYESGSFITSRFHSIKLRSHID